MHLPQQPTTRDAIMASLDDFKAMDMDWQSGKMFAYNYKAPPETEAVCKEAYMHFLGENGLDPTAVPSVMELEKRIVRMTANLLRGDENVVGNFTSGGTESILLSVKTARDYARATKGITAPELIMPRTAHCAFHKACQYFDIKPVITGFDPQTYRADVEQMRAAVTPNTIMVMGSAPGYAQGVIDPIEEIGELALEHDLLFHVDGCVGGIQLSIMREMPEYDVPPFDFTVPGVTQISADWHKYGYASKGASTVLYKTPELRRHQIFASSQSTTYALVNTTILSTRSGGPMAGVWATVHHLGREGYERIARDSMDATYKLCDAINATGDLYVLGKPEFCMFSFASDTINVFELQDEIVKRGWYVQPQFSTDSSPHNLHVSMNLHCVPRIDEFIPVLHESLAAVKANQAALKIETVREQVQAMAAAMSPEALAQLSAMAGINGSDLPDRMAMLNSVLDSLPREMCDDLLIGYLNDAVR